MREMNRIEVIKELRDKGAGVRMLDDVADYVGGYDSPLFIPTIEFMLKMRFALGIEKQVNQSVEVEVGGQEQLPEKYDPDYFKNVSLEAAHDCAPSIENIESQQMNEMQNYLSDMIEQENMHMLQLEREVAINLEKSKTSNKLQEKKMEGQQKKAEKEAIIEEIANNAKEKSQDNNPNSSKNKRNANQQIQGANQGSTRRSSVQEKKPVTIRKSLMSLLNTYLTKAEKRDLKSAVGAVKDKGTEKIEVAVVQQNNQQQQQQQQQKQQEPEKQESKRNSRKHKNNAMDSLFSGMIDKIVKSSKENKPDLLAKPDEKALQAAKDSESTKHRDQVGKENIPRADDKKVAEMSAKDAIDKLRESGVKPIVQDVSTAPSVKEVMDKQTQEQLKKNDQVQR